MGEWAFRMGEWDDFIFWKEKMILTSLDDTEIMTGYVGFCNGHFKKNKYTHKAKETRCIVFRRNRDS